MDYKIKIFAIFLIFFKSLPQYNYAQQTEIPYTPVANICNLCICLSSQDYSNHILSCHTKNLRHMPTEWPKEFGTNHTDQEITATFSGNTIIKLQLLPYTKAKLSFSCRHCSIKEIQTTAFIDVPNIVRLDLSWNELTGNNLHPDIFRGPYNSRLYEPIYLNELDLSHNQIHTLNKRLFEHTPYLNRLNLASNKFDIIDVTTSQAIESIQNLEYLDLSYNDLKSLSESLFRSLSNLNELNLQYNQFENVPAQSLNSLSSSLMKLNLAGNPIEKVFKNDLIELKLLIQLNISDIIQLKTIELGSFSKMNNLEVLHCRNNSFLTNIDFEGLKNCKNLKELDISNCALKSFNMEINFENTQVNSTSNVSSNSSSDSDNKTLSSSSSLSSETNKITSSSSPSSLTPIWKKLRILKISNNQWNCDCMLIRIIENFNKHILHNNEYNYVRCTRPYDLAGLLIYNLTSDYICNLPIPRKLKIPIYDPPSFLKPKSIALSIVTVTSIVAFALFIGFGAIILRKKLRKNEFGFTIPIRYTTVRNSTMSVE